MPCSCCGGAGHNIRTCSSGPTPGGVSGMRARASSSSNSYRSSPSPSYNSGYSSISYTPAVYVPEPTPLFTSGRDKSSSSSKRDFENLKTDITNKIDEKISDMKGLVLSVGDNYERFSTSVNRKFDLYERMLNDQKDKDSKSFANVLAKLDNEAKRNKDTYNNILDYIDAAKNETIKIIDTKFKLVFDRMVIIDKRTKENEQKIRKHEEDIFQIKEILARINEKLDQQQEILSKQQEKAPENVQEETTDDEAEEGVSDESDEDEEEELLSTEEMMKLSLAMVKSLKKCRTKKDQFQAITALSLKFINKK